MFTPRLGLRLSQYNIPVPNRNLKTYARFQSTTIPRSIKALYVPPLKNEIKYGNLKCDIQLRAYEPSNLILFADFIQRCAYYLGIPMTGPKPLPTRRERWTVIKSPFVHAKSKQNFERHTHKRLLRCWDCNDKVLQILIANIVKYSIAGVGVKCNFYKKEPMFIDFDKIDKFDFMDTTETSNEVDLISTDPSSKETRPDLVNDKILDLIKDQS